MNKNLINTVADTLKLIYNANKSEFRGRKMNTDQFNDLVCQHVRDSFDIFSDEDAVAFIGKNYEELDYVYNRVGGIDINPFDEPTEFLISMMEVIMNTMINKLLKRGSVFYVVDSFIGDLANEIRTMRSF